MATPLEVRDHDSDFADAVLTGLRRPQKTIPCRWLYDPQGSHLFEEITQLPEYYPTRTETQILRDNVSEIAAVAGRRARLIEYGAGASVKTRILLNALPDLACYAPIDISARFLSDTVARLRRDYPELTVTPIAADFMARIEAGPAPAGAGATLGFFPGSTIGNLSDGEIRVFLRNARHVLGAAGLFVVGFDLRKSLDLLLPAYDDAAGVTAAFNLNLLTRINRDLGGNFDVDAFRHEARWNELESRVEMHLVSRKTQTVEILGERTVFADGESIHTENSRKFTLESIADTAALGGWRLAQTWVDGQRKFCVALLRA